uniref:hypothetical protein n=1 Tax=Ideonella paludis TaxID=1233411 RepID=UPI0036D2560F
MQPALLGLFMGPHHPTQAALVRQRQRGIAQALRARHQLLRVRGTRQKAEIAAAVEFGVGSGHEYCIFIQYSCLSHSVLGTGSTPTSFLTEQLVRKAEQVRLKGFGE